MTASGRLEKLEQIFFDEGPEALRHAALLFCVLGFVGGSVLVMTAEGGFDPRFLWFTGIGLVPASLCWLLSIAIRHRHLATIPLCMALCALSLYVFGRNPKAAISGTSLNEMWLIIGWFVVVLEYALVAGLLFFVFWLWRKGSFSGGMPSP